ncbi:glycosyltransferase [Streptomyces sp. NPDC000405]|uniref:glycosyltransferase n=1 Tax=Streptomyces sp. NPDC000405 TaxID=3161033 RepID=UPI00398D2C96
MRTPTRMRVLVICATDGFLRSLPLNAAATRALELNRHLAEGDHGMEVSMLLYDHNPASTPTASWPFPVRYLAHDDYYAPDHARLTELVREARPDVLVISDSALLVRCGRQLADAAACTLVYDMPGPEKTPPLAQNGEPGGAQGRTVQGAAIRMADAVFTLTGPEARRASDASAAQVHIVPQGATPNSAVPGGSLGGRVVLAADCTTEANQEALRTLNDRLPAEVSAAVYGRHPALLQLQLSALTLYGPVPDLHAALTTASAGIVPHADAPGIRAQVLAYMAAGLPVVATRQALAGFPHPTSFALISKVDGMADLADLLAVLRKDPGLTRQLGRNGHRLISSGLSWGHVAGRAASAYRAVRPSRRGTRADGALRALADDPPAWLSALHDAGRLPGPRTVDAPPEVEGAVAVDCAREAASAALDARFVPSTTQEDEGAAIFHSGRHVLTVFTAWPRDRAQRALVGLRAAAHCGHLAVPRILGHGHLPASVSWVATSRLRGTPLIEAEGQKAAHVLLGEVAARLHGLQRPALEGLPRFGRPLSGTLASDASPFHRHLGHALERADRNRADCTVSFVHGNLHAGTILTDSRGRPQITGFSRSGVGCPDEDLATLYVHHARDGHWGELWGAYQEITGRAVDLDHVAWHAARYIQWAHHGSTHPATRQAAAGAVHEILAFLTDGEPRMEQA